MSVRIRMRRMGAKKKPFYRIVVADSRKPRGGRYIENLGFYNPMKEPPDINIEEEKLFGWLNKGAQPSNPVWSLLSRVGLKNKWEMLKRGEDVSQIELLEPKARVKKKKKVKAGEAAEERPAEVKVAEEKKSEPKAEKTVQEPEAEETSEATSEVPAPEEKAEEPAKEKEGQKADAKAAEPEVEVKSKEKKSSSKKEPAEKKDEDTSPQDKD